MSSRSKSNPADRPTTNVPGKKGNGVVPAGVGAVGGGVGGWLIGAALAVTNPVGVVVVVGGGAAVGGYVLYKLFK